MNDPALDAVDRALDAVDRGLDGIFGGRRTRAERRARGGKHAEGTTQPTPAVRAARSKAKSKAARRARREARR